MASNPATLAASRAMLNRNNSTQSNLSAAAAATALKRANSTTFQQDRRPSSAGNDATGSPNSPRPGLRRRTSSMSERSFRATAPEDAARERRDRPASLMEVTPEKDKPVKRRGSFTIPMSLRSNSQSKKQQTAAPGVIQPLPQQKKVAKPQTQQQHKLKTSLRGERERPMSPPTHSAMRLPHIAGPGSSASSIRSFQTDLSSIAEDHPLDHLSPNTKGSSHFYPMKSAMKGGSGPPSIISEAVSEESRSSLGAHDRKGKARVSFSDAEPEPPQIMNLGSQKGNNGLLKPENAALLGRPVSLPASPPISPPLSPQVPTQVPSALPATKNTAKKTKAANSTNAATQEWVSTTSQQTTLPFELNSLPRTTGTTIPSQPLNVDPIPAPTISKPAVAQPKQSIPQINHVPQVTIHVPSTASSRPKSKLPGSFPDPTPEPTPPSTAGSQFTDAQEKYDTVSPLPPRNKQLSPVADVGNDLDLQRGLSLRTLSLVPTKPGVTSSSNLTVTGGEDMARRRSSESAGSGVSIYSDAVDDLSVGQKKEASDVARDTRNNTQVNWESVQGRPTSPNEAAQVRPSSPKVAKAPESTTQARPSTPKEVGTGVAAATVAAGATKATTTKAATKKTATTKSAATSKAPATTQSAAKPAGPTKAASATNLTIVTKPPTSPSTGTTIPLESPIKTSQNGTAAPVKSTPMKSSLRASSVPPISPTSPTRERKPMRMSMRADRTTSTTSADMARGLMSLPRIERVPSDSSFKRLKPRGNRDESVARTTLRGSVVVPEREPARTTLRKGRRGSDSSDEIMVGGRGRASSFLGRFRRRESSFDQPLSTTRGPIVGSRFDDSSEDDEELVPPARGVGRAYEDTESLPPASPTVKKRSSFSQMFRRSSARPTSKGSATAPVVPTIATTTTPMPPPLPMTTVANNADGEIGGHRRTQSVSGSIVSKRTGKEKRFQGLRKLFRIKE